MNLCWLFLYTSGQKTQSSGSRDRAFVFFYLRVQVGSSPVLFKCQIKRFSSRCKTGAAHSLYQEQNVLPLPITSYPPGCLAYGLCIIYLLAYPLAACSLPNSGQRRVSGPSLCGDVQISTVFHTQLQHFVAFWRLLQYYFTGTRADEFLQCESLTIFKDPLSEQ